jgi:ribosomal protein S18 acetylase RimI-like enzyme
MAYIGLVGVDPAYQRRGIAMALMQYLLRWSAEHGSPVLQLDASPAGAPLYERLGFADDGQTVSFMHEDRERRPPHSELVEPLQIGDVLELAAFDAPIFGANRAAVFELLLREAPERAFVVRGGAGEIAGYLFAQSATIGPWAARTPAAAVALLGAALQLSFALGPAVLAPSANPHTGVLLQRYGFSANRALRHMRLGGTGSIGRRELLYGLASFAIG